ncbi:MAG: DMT family transporter [Eubacteriales bacterium]|nr:DMT family transporter [Eubacteriales bacterium]
MNQKTHKRALLAALAASTIFGFSFMFSKMALDVAAPTVLLAFRFSASFVVMTLLIGVNALIGKLRGKPLFAFSLRGKPIGSLVLLGIAQPTLYFIFESYGILYTSSAVAGTIIAVVPVMCILVDVLILREGVRLRQVLCALLCVGGVLLVDLGGEVKISWLGMLFLVLTVACDVTYYALSHKAGKQFRPLEVTYVMFTVGMVVFVPAALIQNIGDLGGAFLPAIHSSAFWAAVIFLGVLSSLVAYSLLNYTNAHVSVSEASIFSNVTTVVSVLAGVILLKEPFGLWQVLGVAIILVCVYWANQTTKQ